MAIRTLDAGGRKFALSTAFQALGHPCNLRKEVAHLSMPIDCLTPIYTSPDHRGVAVAMRMIHDTPPPGYTIRFVDHDWALCAFVRTNDPRVFQSELGRIRRRHRWPPQMASTIHKAKGLEFDHVLLCPVDCHQYPDGMFGARLLYVTLSRAKRSIGFLLVGDAPTRHLVMG
mgnify:CR=1 FL=1